MLIEQVLLLIYVPLPAIVYSLEAILFLGRVRSKTRWQGLVLKQSIVPWHPLFVNLPGLSNFSRNFKLGRTSK